MFVLIRIDYRPKVEFKDINNCEHCRLAYWQDLSIFIVGVIWIHNIICFIAAKGMHLQVFNIIIYP